MSKTAPLSINNYNYRIEFQFRGAPHAHGVLWINWEKMSYLSQSDKQCFIEAKNLIRHSQKLQLHHKQAMEKVADLTISVSLRNPAVIDIVKEVQVHKHTAKACKKYGTGCRFIFPKYPIHKTLISTPSNYAFENEEEKNSKMRQSLLVMKAVKKVLEDDELMKKIVSHKQIELESLFASSKAKWRINQLIENAEYQGKDISHIPEDLQNYFSGALFENGSAHISNIRNIYSSIPDTCEEMDALLKERIEYMLEYTDFDLSEGVQTKLEEYENALSVNCERSEFLTNETTEYSHRAGPIGLVPQWIGNVILKN